MKATDRMILRDRKKIGRQIKQKRKDMCWSIYRLGDESGVSRTIVTSIEAGNSSYTIDSLTKILYALDMRCIVGIALFERPNL